MHRSFPKEADLSSVVYKTFIKLLSCAWCGKPGPSEPHHVRRRGSGVTDDTTCVPSCHACHRRCEDATVNGKPSISRDEQWEAVEYYRAMFLTEATPEQLRKFADDVQSRQEVRIF